MIVVRRLWHWLVGELHELRETGEANRAQADEAVIKARQERVNLAVAVQSRRWTSTS